MNKNSVLIQDLTCSGQEWRQTGAFPAFSSSILQRFRFFFIHPRSSSLGELLFSVLLLIDLRQLSSILFDEREEEQLLTSHSQKAIL